MITQTANTERTPEHWDWLSRAALTPIETIRRTGKLWPRLPEMKLIDPRPLAEAMAMLKGGAS